jgi:subtilisin-like proprotein convertase family protein
MIGKVLGLVLGLMLVPSAGIAAQRALVIGINDYQNVPKLSKAVGDADAMSAKLETLGFEVTRVINPGRREFNAAISSFRQSLKPGDVAFVHYSGHGVEIDGHDLLLPKDIPVPASGQSDYLAEEAIDLDDLMNRVAESGAGVRVFVIDACRDNPFASADRRGLGQARGLALVEPPRGSFVLYSAGYGQTALDSLGEDDRSPTSVYTRVLLQKLDAPGLSISQLAREVRTQVAALAVKVGHEQYPAYYDELTEDYYLQPAAGGRNAEEDVEAIAFNAAKAMGTREAWTAFLKNYSTGVFADLAKAAQAALDSKGPGGTAADRVRYTASASQGLLATIAVPERGRVTAIQLDFEFSADCENDYWASLEAPGGQRVVIMDRGLHRCSGSARTFDGTTIDPPSMVGTEAHGDWQLVFKDLDANAHSGSLRRARLRLTLDDNGSISEHTVALDGLPKAIPNPS